MGQCPSSYISNGGFTCVYDCRTQAGFVNRVSGGQHVCALESDPNQTVALRPIPAVPFKPGTQVGYTLDEFRTVNPRFVAGYDDETKRAKEELAILDEKVGKAKKLKDAFQRLQDAENARDKAPDAYQKARVDYYTLLKGNGWKQEEMERIARAEVNPEVQKYENNFASLSTQLSQQKKAYDIMQGVKDKVFRVRDDLNYSANLLAGQVKKVRSQIDLDRRKNQMDQGEPGWVVWTDMILNILLIVALGVAGWFIFQKLRQPKTPPAFTQGSPST